MSRRWTFLGVGLLAVMAAAAAVALARGDEPRDEARTPTVAAAQTATAPAAPPQPDRVLVLVRRRGGLPASWVRRLRRSPAVDALAEVSRTQWLLRRSRHDAPPGARPMRVSSPARHQPATGPGTAPSRASAGRA